MNRFSEIDIIGNIAVCCPFCEWQGTAKDCRAMSGYLFCPTAPTETQYLLKQIGFKPLNTIYPGWYRFWLDDGDKEEGWTVDVNVVDDAIVVAKLSLFAENFWSPIRDLPQVKTVSDLIDVIKLLSENPLSFS